MTKIIFNPTIPYLFQIMDEIKRQIVSGERKPGEKIESVRIVMEMGINPNTGQRAFADSSGKDLCLQKELQDGI